MSQGRNACVLTALSALAMMCHVNATDPYHVVFHLENLERGKSGDVIVKVHPDWAPAGAERFGELLERRFYDNNFFFRVVCGFVAQFGINGDPKVNREWQGKTIIDDPQLSNVANDRGMLSFFTDGKENDRSTQLIFEMKSSEYYDDHGYVPFAEVVEGMFHIDRIYNKYGGSDRAPDQGKLTAEGNAFAKKDFPELTYIKSVEIIKDGPFAAHERLIEGKHKPGHSHWIIACAVFVLTAIVGSGWFFHIGSASVKPMDGGEP